MNTHQIGTILDTFNGYTIVRGGFGSFIVNDPNGVFVDSFGVRDDAIACILDDIKTKWTASVHY